MLEGRFAFLCSTQLGFRWILSREFWSNSSKKGANTERMSFLLFTLVLSMQQKAVLLQWLACMKEKCLLFLLTRFINAREFRKGKEIMSKFETAFDIQSKGSSANIQFLRCKTKLEVFLLTSRLASQVFLIISMVPRIDFKTISKILELSFKERS